jgi:hypothetical protein
MTGAENKWVILSEIRASKDAPPSRNDDGTMSCGLGGARIAYAAGHEMMMGGGVVRHRESGACVPVFRYRSWESSLQFHKVETVVVTSRFVAR